MLRRLVCSGLLLLLAGGAWAQSVPVYQSGSMVSHHLPKFLANGKVGDAGGLTGDVNGRGVAPFSVQDNLGLGQCFNSAATSGGYRAFCLGHDASGNALLTVDSYGGAGSGSLKARVNGATVDLVTGSTSGLAAIATSGSATDLTTGTVPSARLVAVPNASLANASVTISGHALALGGSLALASGDVSGLAASATTDATNASNIATGSLANARLANSAMTIAGHSVALGGTQAISCGDLSDDGPYCPAVLGQLPGTTTNDSATSGNIGQVVTNSVSSGSAVSLTNATNADIMTISVPAGDWDIRGDVFFIPGGTTTVTAISGFINTTSVTDPGTTGPSVVLAATLTTGRQQRLALPAHSYKFSTTTTVRLIASSEFGTSTMGGYGWIEARRVR